MDLIIVICLVFLTGLFVGAFFGIASVCFGSTGKRHDQHFENECDAIYPRSWE
jgi:hypothetical protein